MSKFYVGQRVRIKWSTGWPALAGAEGEILYVSDGMPCRARQAGMHPLGGGTYYGVAPSGQSSNTLPGGRLFEPTADQLEPLQPERNKTIAWSDERCVWKPEHMRAEA